MTQDFEILSLVKAKLALNVSELAFSEVYGLQSCNCWNTEIARWKAIKTFENNRCGAKWSDEVRATANFTLMLHSHSANGYIFPLTLAIGDLQIGYGETVWDTALSINDNEVALLTSLSLSLINSGLGTEITIINSTDVKITITAPICTGVFTETIDLWNKIVSAVSDGSEATVTTKVHHNFYVGLVLKIRNVTGLDFGNPSLDYTITSIIDNYTFIITRTGYSVPVGSSTLNTGIIYPFPQTLTYLGNLTGLNIFSGGVEETTPLDETFVNELPQNKKDCLTALMNI